MMNPGKALRNAFIYSTFAASAFSFSSCSEENVTPDKPDPKPEPKTTLTGYSDKLGLTLYDNSFTGGGIGVVGSDGKNYTISLMKAEEGKGNNATLEFTNVDIVDDAAQLYLAAGDQTVATDQVKSSKAILKIKAGSKDVMGLTLIEFDTNSKTSLGVTPGDPVAVAALKDDIVKYKVTAREALEYLTDTNKETTAKESLPLFIKVWAND